MAQASIPVDLFNPGQVFACLGFLEAAEVLLGNARGGFDWANEAQPRFEIHADGVEANPFEAVLEFLAKAEVRACAHPGYKPPTKQKKGKAVGTPSEDSDNGEAPSATAALDVLQTFPGPHGDPMTLPVRLADPAGERRQCVLLTHWCDASSRRPFKLFAGQQRSATIAQQMRSALGELWEKRRKELVRDPLGPTVPLGGSSFKLDARKAWVPINAGYSPDEQKHAVEASPVVEMLAAIGLEHARPDEFETRKVRYGVWKGCVPPVLARPALGGVRVGVPVRVFRFTLDVPGRNKNVTFAREETNP